MVFIKHKVNLVQEVFCVNEPFLIALTLILRKQFMNRNDTLKVIIKFKTYHFKLFMILFSNNENHRSLKFFLLLKLQLLIDKHMILSSFQKILYQLREEQITYKQLI